MAPAAAHSPAVPRALCGVPFLPTPPRFPTVRSPSPCLPQVSRTALYFPKPLSAIYGNAMQWSYAGGFLKWAAAPPLLLLPLLLLLPAIAATSSHRPRPVQPCPHQRLILTSHAHRCFCLPAAARAPAPAAPKPSSSWPLSRRLRARATAA